MIVLGFNGWLDFPYENEVNLRSVDLHDAAAALIVDGKIVSAIEEERLNRIKHSNKTSLFSAAKFVMEDYGIEYKDVDKFCYYFTEENTNVVLKNIPNRDFIPIRERLVQKMNQVFGCDCDEGKLCFVHHHLAHAMSVYALSAFEKSLILTIDGAGDNIAGMVLNAEGGKMDVVDDIPLENSLGIFYTILIEYLGFRRFDEYKVMGLAPYGNPEVYRDIFKAFYKLLPDGGFKIVRRYFDILKDLPGIPREKNQPLTQVHKDVSAALQEALERIVLHYLEYYKNKYNHTKLCMAGGVAQNCTMNGKILYSGMFDDIFVQPASYDAGTAIGAALYTYYRDTKSNSFTNSRLEHVYWGSHIGINDTILEKLKGWESFVEYEKVDNIAQSAAQLLAEGAVIGWVQGKSEFGPRALGNRSILADPRPAENKDIINAMVKKRETFRPFAPSVLEEYLEEYYDVPDNLQYRKFPFMTFVLNVKKEKQAVLGAVTHVDGTARIQSVSKETNKKYWELIDAFREITGIPILLNTSFNNNVEPIVNSLEDAMTCYLTTSLNYLVVGEYLISKKDIDEAGYWEMVPSLPLHVELIYKRKYSSSEHFMDIYQIRDNYLVTDKAFLNDPMFFPDISFGVVKSNISRDLYFILTCVDGRKSLFDLVNHRLSRDEARRRNIIEEIKNIWSLRLIKLEPKTNR